MLRKVKEEYEKISNQLNSIENELKKGANGKRMYCMKHKNSYSYYVDGKYLSKKDLSIAKEINKRDYYTRIKKDLEPIAYHMNELIKACEKFNKNNIYIKMSEGRRALLDDAIYKTPNQVIDEFECERLTDKNDSQKEKFMDQYPIESEIYTDKGEHVRSKSEKIIADALFRKEIPYRYESPITLKYNSRPVTFYPDFTVLNKRTGKKYYIEHLGLMTDEDYSRKAINKISIYEKNGILLGRNLILLYETDYQPLSTSILNSYIDEYLI